MAVKLNTPTQEDVLKLANELLAEWQEMFPNDEGNTLENALESAKAELNVKDMKLLPRGEALEKPKKPRTPKPRKVDETKKGLIGILTSALEAAGIVISGVKNEAEIHFSYEKSEYTIKLVKHRPPKK